MTTSASRTRPQATLQGWPWLPAWTLSQSPQARGTIGPFPSPFWSRARIGRSNRAQTRPTACQRNNDYRPSSVPADVVAADEDKRDLIVNVELVRRGHIRPCDPVTAQHDVDRCLEESGGRVPGAPGGRLRAQRMVNSRQQNCSARLR